MRALECWIAKACVQTTNFEPLYSFYGMQGFFVSRKIENVFKTRHRQSLQCLQGHVGDSSFVQELLLSLSLSLLSRLALESGILVRRIRIVVTFDFRTVEEKSWWRGHCPPRGVWVASADLLTVHSCPHCHPRHLASTPCTPHLHSLFDSNTCVGLCVWIS